MAVVDSSAPLFTRVSKTYGRRSGRPFLPITPLPGHAVIAHVSVEVPQQDDGVPSWGTIQHPSWGSQKGSNSSIKEGPTPLKDFGSRAGAVCRGPRLDLPPNPHCTGPKRFLLWVVGLLEDGPMSLLLAGPGRAPWAKARPPGSRRRATSPGLAPGWGPGPALWSKETDPDAEHGGEQGATLPSEITSKCTQVCGGNLSEAARRELCIFCDALTKAIEAVAYLKVIDAVGNCEIGFVMGKAKLTPRPEQTIPRLELCAAVLAVELEDLVSGELDIQLNDTHFYTDSKVMSIMRPDAFMSMLAIGWLVLGGPQWHYVPTDQNPADLATGSVPAHQLMLTNWFTGPEFLLKDNQSPVQHTYILVEPSSDTNIRPQVSTLKTTTKGGKIDTLVEKYCMSRGAGDGCRVSPSTAMEQAGH
ncbi:hypothetical protein L3Q82_005039 [Scortum barcoo]|uniref:Uncharacterized protein n=1 Tax=Scortum barcoo TaxID=214431 RepID=A0ACB8VE29_9TELE|nr:hypothetical protein L3Q82_005039 [Scortum barcoo]